MKRRPRKPSFRTQRQRKLSVGSSLFVFARFLFGFAASLLVLGFAVFVIYVNLAKPPTPLPKVDGIVVLTGPGGGRLDAAAQLLKQGYGERLLISGVNPANDSERIRELLDIDEDKFLCCVDLDYEAANTVDNAQQTANWTNILGYEHVILVTSSYHMPRAQLEIGTAKRNLNITPYPVKSPKDQGQPWWGGVEKTKRLFREFGKLIVSFVRDPGRRGNPDTSS